MKISKTLLGVIITGVLLLGWQSSSKAFRGFNSDAEPGTQEKEEVAAPAAEAAAPAAEAAAPAAEAAAPAAEAAAPAAEAAAPAEEGAPLKLSVVELFAKKAELNGKKVVVFGNVVKVNLGVMGMNWIHLQDGTGEKGTNDITITTDGRASPKDKVSVTGIVATDKDFGAGYKYSIIIEKAVITVQ